MRSLFSSSWYRFSDLKPRLRSHAQLHRQVFRGDVWYVLEDHHTGRFHRVSPVVNLMLCMMDGRRTVQEIWTLAIERQKEHPPTQDETIQLLSQLHASDLLLGDFVPDLAELSERSDRSDRREWIQQLRNPLSFRLPLFDPDRLLNLTAPLGRILFSTAGFIAWTVLILSALILIVLHWPELSQNNFDRLLATENVLVILLVYPVVKTLHEAGHALATKRWGGEVHEVGLMLLIFIPVGYVDASSSAAFLSKRRRIVVGAAGMLVELTLAAIATIVWVNAAPGLVRTVAFNVILIGGLSTLFFNGNPLLRFDGYYILADLIETPNLGIRANKYFFYLLQRYIFGITALDSPVTGRGEGPWFFFYSIASFLYRTMISIGIALFLSKRFFFVGSLLALWTVSNIVLFPAVSGARYLISGRDLNGHRRRAYLVLGGTAIAIALALFAIPLPYASVAEGVLWIPERAEIRAQTSGIVENFAAANNTEVTAQTALVRLSDPVIESQVALRKAQLNEMFQRLHAVRLTDRNQAQIINEQIRHLQSALDLLSSRRADLVVRADQAGRFVTANETDLPGRYVRKGDLLGYVLAQRDTVIRTIVSQSDVDLVRQRTDRVDVRFVDKLGTTYSGRIGREVPGANQEIPSLALTTQGGGTIAIDPGTRSPKPQALYGLFQFDIGIESQLPANYIGQRAFIRFDFGREPIAWRIVRFVQQAFLGKFRG